MGEWFSAGGEWIAFEQIQAPVSFPQKQTIVRQVVAVVGQLLRASILVSATTSGIPPINDETGLGRVLGVPFSSSPRSRWCLLVVSASHPLHLFQFSFLLSIKAAILLVFSSSNIHAMFPAGF